ncbi:MAG: MATE family efflux transporter, partial [Clostridia bacterium]|nr:MATE family efflux transporter [Clostridia bacterium]
QQEAGEIIGSGVWLFGALAVIVSIATVAAAPLLTALMHAPAEAAALTSSYIAICGGGAVFIMAYNLVGSIFRGIGNSRIPLMAVIFACVFNILGDYLLVGVFRMAAAGAAIATVAAQALSVLLSLLIIRRQKLPFTLTRGDIRFDAKRMGEVLKLGFPIALQDVLVSISFLVITAIVNTLGVIISAGVGIAEKLCGFIMLVPSSFSQAMSAFVAQNMGAKEPGRAKRGLFCGIAASLAVGALMFYLSFFHGDILSGIFVSGKDPAVIAASWEYLKSYGIDCLLTAFLFCMTGYFNGCGKTTFVMAQGIVGAFCVRVPASYLFSRMLPVSVFRIGLATPCSTLVQITLCFQYFFLLSRREKRSGWQLS